MKNNTIFYRWKYNTKNTEEDWQTKRQKFEIDANKKEIEFLRSELKEAKEKLTHAEEQNLEIQDAQMQKV